MRTSMKINRVKFSSAGRRRVAFRRPGFTLLELLVVISIIALLISILLPSLSAAREAGNVGKCLANLKTLGATSQMYMDDAGEYVQPWHFGFNNQWGNVTLISEHVYGGFQVTTPHPMYGLNTDMAVIPTAARPYNRYIAPGVTSGLLKEYVCPSDKTYSTPNVNNPCDPPLLNVNYKAYELNGTSYALNWYWVEGAPWNGDQMVYQDPTLMAEAGREMLKLKVGGAASRFAIFMENSLNSYMLDARPRDGEHGMSCLQTLGDGWHRKRSKYTMAMLDGHAEYRFVDTRYSNDVGFDIWPEKGTQLGF